MTERYDQLNRIVDDLEHYIEVFCPCAEDGKPTDFSGEKCSDAYLMLQEALGGLKEGA